MTPETAVQRAYDSVIRAVSKTHSESLKWDFWHTDPTGASVAVSLKPIADGARNFKFSATSIEKGGTTIAIEFGLFEAATQMRIDASLPDEAFSAAIEAHLKFHNAMQDIVTRDTKKEVNHAAETH